MGEAQRTDSRSLQEVSRAEEEPQLSAIPRPFRTAHHCCSGDCRASLTCGHVDGEVMTMMLVVVGRRRPGMAGKALLRTPCGQLRLFAPLSAAIGGRLQQRRGGLTVVSIARRPNGSWPPRHRGAGGA